LSEIIIGILPVTVVGCGGAGALVGLVVGVVGAGCLGSVANRVLYGCQSVESIIVPGGGEGAVGVVKLCDVVGVGFVGVVDGFAVVGPLGQSTCYRVVGIFNGAEVVDFEFGQSQVIVVGAYQPMVVLGVSVLFLYR